MQERQLEISSALQIRFESGFRRVYITLAYGTHLLVFRQHKNPYMCMRVYVQARSWHADDVIRTPHVASRPFFFFFSRPQVVCLGKVRFSGTKLLE